MDLIPMLLSEFDREMTTTRTLLARVPEDRSGWGPHPRSMSIDALATHLTNIPTWGSTLLTSSEFDLATAPPPAIVASQAERLDRFDRHVATTRSALTGINVAALSASWTLTRGGQVLFTLPRLAAWRTLVVNHAVHHRGQLSVYLRLLDIPVPSIYGASADEGGL